MLVAMICDATGHPNGVGPAWRRPSSKARQADANLTDLALQKRRVVLNDETNTSPATFIC